MNQTKLIEIERKRDYFFLAESTYPRINQLLKEREELEKKSKEIVQLISKQIYSPPIQDPEPLNLELKKIQKEIKQIDSLLDEWDDLQEVDFQLMRENLLLEIWDCFPGEFEEQKLIWDKLKYALELESQLNNTQKFLDELNHVLGNIRKTRVQMKGKGFLSYIFGTSPNAIIENHLLFAHQLISNHQEWISHLIRENPSSKIFQDIYLVTDELKTDCKKIWGFRHIDTTISDHEKKTLVLSSQLQELHQKTEEQISTLKQDIDRWLSQIDYSVYLNH